jgi:hypothetical protein
MCSMRKVGPRVKSIAANAEMLAAIGLLEGLGTLRPQALGMILRLRQSYKAFSHKGARPGPRLQAGHRLG